MRNLFLAELIFAIFLFSCNSATEATEAEKDINEAELIEEREIEQVPEEALNESKENTFDLNKMLAVFNKGGILPQKYYSLFNLETTDFVEEFEIGLKPKKLNDFYILTLNSESNMERDDGFLDFIILFYSINKTRIISSLEIVITKDETRPDINILENNLIKVLVNIPELNNEYPFAKPTGKTLTNVKFIKIEENGELSNIDVPLYYTSVKELRLFRNEIFARYGYKFKSKDLQEHFAKFEWYNPEYENVDKLLTFTDKEIINYIKQLENQKQ